MPAVVQQRPLREAGRARRVLDLRRVEGRDPWQRAGAAQRSGVGKGEPFAQVRQFGGERVDRLGDRVVPVVLDVHDPVGP